MLTARQFTTRKWSIVDAALAYNARLDDIESHYKSEILKDMIDLYPRGLSLHGALEVAAIENGWHHLDYRNSDDLFRCAFRQRGGFSASSVRAGGYSTIEMPGIPSNIANKFLIEGFNAIEHGYRSIAGVRSATDFKQISTYSLT